MRKIPWKMPSWMEAYRMFLSAPYRAEEYQNCDLSCDKPEASRHLLCRTVRAEISLLSSLKKAGKLKTDDSKIPMTATMGNWGGVK